MSATVITLARMSVAVITYDQGMGRWEPDSRGRLEQAALALYSERGFDNTTVAEIAARAGVTERTFFRYFADKREVLFSGAGTLQELLVNAVVRAPDSVAPIDAAEGFAIPRTVTSTGSRSRTRKFAGGCQRTPRSRGLIQRRY